MEQDVNQPQNADHHENNVEETAEDSVGSQNGVQTGTEDVASGNQDGRREEDMAGVSSDGDKNEKDIEDKADDVEEGKQKNGGCEKSDVPDQRNEDGVHVEGNQVDGNDLVEGDTVGDSVSLSQVFDLMRRYFAKWRKRTFPEVLNRNKLAKAAVLVSFCQQVHIYNQEMYFHMYRMKDAIDVSEIMPTRGRHKRRPATVLSSENKEYFRNSKICRQELVRRSYHQEPDVVENEKAEEAREDKGETVTETESENETANNNVHNDAGTEDENVCIDSASADGPYVAVQPKHRPECVDTNNDICRQNLKRCQDSPTNFSSKKTLAHSTEKSNFVTSNKRQNPIEEMAQKAAEKIVGCQDNDDNNDRGPFNFQALLRKTNIPRRDSLRRVNEIQEPPPPWSNVKPNLSLTTICKASSLVLTCVADDEDDGSKPNDVSPKSSAGSTLSSPQSERSSPSCEDQATTTQDGGNKSGSTHKSCRSAIARHRAVMRVLSENYSDDTVIQTAGASRTGAEEIQSVPRGKPKRLFESRKAQSMFVDHVADSRHNSDVNQEDSAGTTTEPESEAEIPHSDNMETAEDNNDEHRTLDSGRNSGSDDNSNAAGSHSPDGSMHYDSDVSENSNADDVQSYNRNENINNMITHITIMYDSTNQEGEYELIPGVFISGLSTDL